MLVGLGHLDLLCADVEQSIAFYRAVLGPLGLAEPVHHGGERGETIHYLRFPKPGSGSFGLRQALVPQEYALYAPGLHHVSFAVQSTDEVDGAHERAVAAGAEVLHAPRFWPEYHQAYYATFFCDLDGFRIEIANARDSRL